MTPTKKSPAKKSAKPKPSSAQPTSPMLRVPGATEGRPAKPKAEKAPKRVKTPHQRTSKKTEKAHSAAELPQRGVSAPAPVHHETRHEPKHHKEPPHVPTIRIRLSAFDHTVLDEAAMKIIETAERSGAVIHGPIPLPTHTRKWTVNRSTFIFKDARDQFEMRTHRRLIDLKETTFKTVESLQTLSLPSGVDIEIKMG